MGRRIAEKLWRELKDRSEHRLVRINPDVVEAACLAHDLGHPPFGHIAEQQLDHLARAHGLADGFEGNAQSFRIVTKLAMGSIEYGLNLTRATLNAILKYPWLHGENQDIPDKWGAYDGEEETYNWARSLGPAPRVKCIEAEVMDWADDVTYSVHDVDDFYRAGVIPIDRLVVDADERERFYEEVFERRKGKLPKGVSETYLRGAFDGLITKLPLRKAYSPTRSERIRLRSVTSTLIRDFVNAVEITRTGQYRRIKIRKKRRAEIFMLKQLTWHYVIKNPALASQQHGQKTIVRGLFNAFYRAGTQKRANTDVFPISIRELLPLLPAKKPRAVAELTRTIIDFIASLTEEQAIATYNRLYGIELGSSLVFNVR